MQRKEISLCHTDRKNFIHRLLSYSEQIPFFALLNSNGNFEQYGGEYEFIAACNALSVLNEHAGNKAFDQFRNYTDAKKDWLFGWFSYDMKNEIEDLFSNNTDRLQFPDLFFFQAKYVFYQKKNQNQIKLSFPASVETKEIENLLSKIHNAKTLKSKSKAFHLKNGTSGNEYISNAKKFLSHIQRGDIYEVNYCIDFYSDNAEICPSEMYGKLNMLSPMPFSALFKVKDLYLISASPERFLKYYNGELISQPIKGTAKRADNSKTDRLMKSALKNDPKERAENIMITDLVRNDLSEFAEKSSVEVKELCKVYTFKQLHQLISTITSKCKTETKSTQLIRSCFPPGSMTGAPKVKAMQLAEKYENSKREVYAGALGYFSPQQNFDLSVPIRSLFYNKTLKRLKYNTGSALTAQSVPEKEYEECLLKAKALFEYLQNNPS